MEDQGSSGPEAQWRKALAEGRFLVQRCRATGTHVFPPRVAAPGTGSADLEWVAPSGRGIVHSVTIVRPRPPAEPFNVVIVELDEGPRLMSRVKGLPPEAVAIGLRVMARIAETPDGPLLVFVPDHAA
jgi:uncharacterized OB-fold protein